MYKPEKMETITIEIDKRTKVGKAFLQMIEVFAQNNKKEVKIKEVQNRQQTNYPVSQNSPNSETLRIFKRNEKEKGIKCNNAADMFEKLGI